MLGYVLRRLLGAVPTLFLVVTGAFFLMRVAPGGPFDRERTLEPTVMANLNAAFRLDEPLLTQYLHYLGNLARGDLGPSFIYRDFTVAELLARGLPVSMTLGGLALLLALMVNQKLRCAFHVIRPSVPRASGRAFHEHPATLVRGLRGFSSLLIASPAVKGVGGAEGCPREGPARPAPRRPGGWRCRARGRGRWASRGEGHAHCPASARLSAPVLRSDGPSRAMR